MDLNGQPGWRKSRRSSGGGDNCVEVLDLVDGGRAVRDSKDRGSGPVLTFTAAAWDAFTSGVKCGEFE
ncbi:DUF397 domain-containing protein [Actinoplanes sp. NPDC051859]|uniref:DUF397 domain-containing protein n=1 Tax=Actinoplanes sp. NPDC051859 TaxID=3363909 RepID=UPI0037A27920